MDYFKLRPKRGDMSEWVVFNENPIPSSESPVFNIFRELHMTRKNFVNKANELFSKYCIRVPDDYPSERISKDFESLGKINVSPWNEFAICVGCSILINKEFNKDVRRILKNELIRPNSRGGILHASALSAILLYYLKKGFDVDIPKEQKDKPNPDIIINGLNCEVKAVDESDWTQDIDPWTGRGKKRMLSEDIAYDIGKFISNCGCDLPP